MHLTEDERDAMAHCIGHHSAKGCSVHGGRNYYVTAADDTMWCALVLRGLVVSRESNALAAGEAVFHLTPEGVRAVEHDASSQRPAPTEPRFDVRFRGYAWSITVRARTRGQARYRAARDLTEALNMSTHEALMQIASCTRM